MTQVKICGVTTVEDARAAVDAGADYIGLNFHPPSARFVDLETARVIRKALGDLAKVVGVFVDRPPEEVERVATELSLDAVQLHGNESAQAFSGLRFPIIRALRVRGPESLLELDDWLGCAALLLDGGGGAGTFGGVAFDWSLAKRKRENHPPLWLAGGLGPDNVAEAIRQTRPALVDVASGVESSPGRKDEALMRAFISAVREVVQVTKNPLFPADGPDARGRFGEFGGRYVPETLVPALDELEAAWKDAREDPVFQAELQALWHEHANRPTPLSFARRLTELWGGADVYLKREDLAHTGAHKINNTLGQLLLAKRMGKKRIIAETGAGQHGVATATACALFGLPCEVFMGAEDVRRQAPNVSRMKVLGAKVHAVEAGSRTLKDAMNEAIRYWVANVHDTHYVIGSAAGPHPYPWMVRDLQSVIGRELRAQSLAQTGRLPDAVVACVGGGSNAIGAFHPLIDDPVRLVAVEAAGEGLNKRHGASLTKGRPGVLHGSRSMLLQTDDGQVVEAHSISAGLDYPGVGPELSHLAATGRLEVVSATDEEALSALVELARTEGVICALETAHAVHGARALAKELGAGKTLVVNLSGRGDKDGATIADALFGDAS